MERQANPFNDSLTLLNSVTTGELQTQVLSTLRDVFVSHHHARSAGVEYGMVEEIARFCAEGLSSESRVTAFRCLGELCFDCKPASTLAMQHPSLLFHLARVNFLASVPSVTSLNQQEEEEVVRESEYGIRLVSLCCKSSWECHPGVIASLLPSILARLDSAFHKSQASSVQRCIMCIHNLSLNPSNQSALRPALDILVRVCESKRMDFLCVDAGISANRIGECGFMRMAPEEVPSFVEALLRALPRSRAGLDFPRGSARFFTEKQIIQGLLDISHEKHNRDIMCSQGVFEELGESVGSMCTPRDTRYDALFLAWHLVEDLV